MSKILTRSGYVSLLVLLLLPSTILAQRSFGGQPISFFEANQTPIAKSFELPPINLKQIKLEDERVGGNRFAAPVKVDLDLENAGSWREMPNGDRLWQLKIHSKNALGLVVLYDEFVLPPGAKFYSYSEDKSQILGAYTHESNPKAGRFLTGLIYGESTTLEYYEPASVKGQGRIHIFRVDHAYQKERIQNDYEFKLHSAPMMRGFGTSLPCHVNVNCNSGNSWQDEKKGIVRIMLVVAEGTGWCSGSLINNTNQDGTPYVLSAYHCDDGFTPLHDLWRFDFHYESQDCSNPASEPTYQSALGCTWRAGREQSDFQLLEINDLPNTQEVYYNGWDRSISKVPSNGTMIHHPSGDIKKFSRDNNPLSIYNNTISWLETGVITPANHHFRAELDEGTFEVGSSGSPIFDENSRIVGQLNGGNADCSQFIAYYGRMAMSWDAGDTPASRLKDWLDPGNTGAETLDGYRPGIIVPNFVRVSGVIKTPEGKGIPGVSINFTNASGNAETTESDANGNYSFQAESSASVNFSLSKDGVPTKGVSVSDAVMIHQFALGKIEFESAYKMIAADVNRSGGISVSDLVMVSQLVLGKINEFPGTSPWLFLREDTSFTDPKDALNNPLSQSFHIFNLQIPEELNVNFIGVKMADVNGSVNP